MLWRTGQALEGNASSSSRTNPRSQACVLLASGQVPHGYVAAAVSTFLQAADYYLVAQAHAAGHIVVTHEVLADSTRKIKIPNACNALGVPCIDPFEMLRREGARFVLAP